LSDNGHLNHSIEDQQKKVRAVLLSMNGEIKLGKWCKFSAKQIIEIDHGYLWQANVFMGHFFINGYDLLRDSNAKMRWNLLGLLPVINVSGIDLRRSAIGRYAIETIWIPSYFLSNVKWNVDKNIVKAHFNALNEEIELNLKIDHDGKMKEISMNRWGKIDSKNYQNIPFGAYIEEERCFEGYTIPSRLKAGWFFGTSDYEQKGEFFHVEITKAEYK